MLILLLACSSSLAPSGVLPPGVWGGDQANLIVTTDSARAEFVCASGWLDAPVALDPQGRFDVGGSYRFEAGPVGQPVPARWRGRLERLPGGSVVTLEVIVLNPEVPPDTLGPFHLIGGKRVTTGLCA